MVFIISLLVHLQGESLIFDIENSMSILPTGQFGNIFSNHYDDQAEKYLNGGFNKMMLNQDIEKSKNILILK